MSFWAQHKRKHQPLVVFVNETGLIAKRRLTARLSLSGPRRARVGSTLRFNVAPPVWVDSEARTQSVCIALSPSFPLSGNLRWPFSRSLTICRCFDAGRCRVQQFAAVRLSYFYCVFFLPPYRNGVMRLPVSDLGQTATCLLQSAALSAHSGSELPPIQRHLG